MSSTQEFRRRIKSVNNTKQITKAMEMIASIKMQKAVRTAESARAYIQNAWNMLDKLAGLVLPKDHPLVAKRPAGKTAVILVTSDRGLCGSYNAEIIKKLLEFGRNDASVGNGNEARIGNDNRSRNSASLSDPKAEDRTTNNETGLVTDKRETSLDIIAVGKVGAQFSKKHEIGTLVAEFPSYENNISIENVLPLSKMTIDEFLAKKYDRVVAIYAHFESSLRQTPVVKQILPIQDEHIDKPELWATKETLESPFKFEPTAQEILDAILRQVLDAQIFGSILEANASEHSARMVAMKNATDNAGDLIDELQLVYNTIRQGSITREIAEISGAAESMK